MNWLIWALLSALFAGLTAVLAKVGVAEINSHVATAIRTSVVLVFTWSIALVSVKAGDWPAITPRAWLFLALSGARPVFHGFATSARSSSAKFPRSAPLDKLSVVIAIVLSVVFLSERLTVRECAGVALLVAGALVLASK